MVCATINVAVRMLSTVGLRGGRLRERERVERLQEEFVQMLYRYLTFVHEGQVRRDFHRMAIVVVVVVVVV